MLRVLLLLLALLALLAAGCSREAGLPPTESAPAAPAAASEQAPAIPTLRVETLDHGHFELAAQRGRWVVVNYWATWCAPCVKEMPELAAFDAERDDVTVIGLAYEEIDLPDMRAFLERVPVGYPIALIDVYAPPADLDVPRGLPMTYLIAPDGTIAQRFLGPVTGENLSEGIARHGR
jgi:thiol-disulfide isomerase/thioredoxin